MAIMNEVSDSTASLLSLPPLGLYRPNVKMAARLVPAFESRLDLTGVSSTILGGVVAHLIDVEFEHPSCVTFVLAEPLFSRGR